VSGPGGDAVALVHTAIDLYLGNFDLMVEAPTAAIRRRTREHFLVVQDAVGAHAPWARRELVAVLVAHIEVRASLTGKGGDLRRLQQNHTRAVQALRAFIARSGPPWG
jgi:hypothetical protein